jgi:hypothetical protein
MQQKRMTKKTIVIAAYRPQAYLNLLGPKILKCLWNDWNFFLKLCWFYNLKYTEYHAVVYFRPAIR